MEVLKGKFEKDIKWSKNLELDKQMNIFVQLDSTDQTKSDLITTVKKVKRILDQNGYRYESIMVNGSGFDMEGVKAETEGYLKYSLKVFKDKTVEKSDVEEHNQQL